MASMSKKKRKTFNDPHKSEKLFALRLLEESRLKLLSMPGALTPLELKCLSGNEKHTQQFASE